MNTHTNTPAAHTIGWNGQLRICLWCFVVLPHAACRAKNIKNQAVVNEDADQRTLLRKYERELRKLRAELTRRNKELVDKRHLLEVGAVHHQTTHSRWARD